MFTRRYCMALLQVCFGGRIAEVMFCDDISSGAQSDIEQATRIARQMVLMWGMSDQLGPISYEPDMAGRDYSFVVQPEKDYSEKTTETIDREVRRILEDAYERAKEMIGQNRTKLERIAQALLKYETLDADDVTLILDGGTLDKPTVGDLLAAEQAKGENTESDEGQKHGDSTN
jgi:cell division protease FtsH